MRTDALLSSAAESSASADVDLACPRCFAPGSTLTLLTSMVRYYTCPSCGGTWNETAALRSIPSMFNNAR